jgi:L-rhamnose-H+ transport protein
LPESIVAGLAIVLLAGAFQGSFLLPTKWMKGWAWENYWLIFAVSAYLVCPWILAALTIPHLAQVYQGVPAGSLALAEACGAGWGVGALTFGLGVEALGLALGFAVILGVAATAGTLIPLFVLTPKGFSFEQGMVTAVALMLMLAGVAVCSFAGNWKAEAKVPMAGPSYRRGVLLCIASGLLSACGNLGFAFGSKITERAQSLGAPAHLAGNALWPLLAIPLFLCNAGYSIGLLHRNDTATRYRNAHAPRFCALAFLMGVLWMAGIGLYGVGASKLGTLGPSLGWAILMSAMVLVANVLGMLTGEWKGAPRKAQHRLSLGISILIVAIAVLGYANHLQK